MTSAQETVPPMSKTRLVFQLLGLPCVFVFGLFSGNVLSGVSSFAMNIVLPGLILLALAAAILDLNRSLPAQNIATIVVIVILISGLVQIIITRFGVASGENAWLEAFAPPLIWVVNLLNSRSVARLILRPWRNAPNYGLFTLGLTTLFTGISNLGIEFFGGIQYWAVFFIYAMTAAIALVAITPWLINKKPGPSPASSYAPLLVWVMLLGILFSKRLV